MNTKNMTLFAAAFVVALMISGLGNKATAQPAVNVCAQQMCLEMRNCGQAQGERIQKPNAPKGKESAQGTVAPSCNQLAYQNYIICVGFNKAPGTGNKDKDVTPNNSVTPTTNQK